MEFLKQPKPMKLEGNLAENWKKFLSNYEIYCAASGCKEKSAEVQAAILLHCIGEEAREIFDTLQLSENDKKKPEKIKEGLKNYFVPKTNTSVERHKFNMRSQKPHEGFDQFFGDLKIIAKDCGFGDLRDELIKDRIVCGIRDDRVRERLMRESDLKLTKAVEICKAAEQTEEHIKHIMKRKSNTEGETSEVNAMNKDRKFNHTTNHVNTGRSYPSTSTSYPKTMERNPKRGGNFQSRYVSPKEGRSGQVEAKYGRGGREIDECRRCGRRHDNNSTCSAQGQKCNACGKLNHFARVCRSVEKSKQYTFKRHVNTVSESSDSSQDEYVIGLIAQKQTSVQAINVEKDWTAEILVIDIKTKIRFKLDTGAQINVLPYYLCKKLGLVHKITSHDKKVKITSYGGTELPVKGECLLKCEHEHKTIDIKFIILDTENKTAPIIGLSTLKKLNLIITNQTQENLVREIKKTSIIGKSTLDMSKFDHLFKGIGKIKGIKCDFHLKDNYKAIISATRKVPFGLTEHLKNELTNMQKDKIIREIKEATEFVNPIVLVKKPNGKIRICLDPQNLNASLLREHYQLPTFEELTVDLSKSKYFSTLDANRDFYQIELTEQASKLTTFATRFGRFCFLRLPFGINIAPEIFHRTFKEIFKNIEGVNIYIDDIIIHADSKAKHDKILQKVLERADEFGVKFNKNKCKFRVKEVKYVGHILSEKGIRVDQDKITAITNMPRPQNSKDLSRFLGMITYVNKFIPNLAQKTVNLRNLLKKSSMWNWEQTHEQEFNKIKQALTEAPALQFYDETKDLILSVDASKDGLGAVLLQDNLPIAYASKSMTESQKRYAQIEKETLAILYGCQKFHQYLFGRHFIVESDHKPLEAIFVKPLENCPLRLQRFRINLQNYNFTIIYKPGKYLILPDTLSRASQPNNAYKLLEIEANAQIDLINHYCSISEQKYDEVKSETVKDPEMCELKQLIEQGWPNEKKNLTEAMKPYWKYKDDLSIYEGIICLKNRIVIPKQLRTQIMSKLHTTHLGRDKTIWKAKQLVFWPFMNKQISDKLQSCTACLTFQNKNTHEDLILQQPPTRPWQYIATDFFEYQNRDFLLLVDLFSRYPEVKEFTSGTSHIPVLKELQNQFARYGLPEKLYSDLGPPFSGKEFQEFLKKFSISHRTSSPGNAQSNGFIERHVQTIKKMIKKIIYNNENLDLALLEYRNTPISAEMPSPAELMFGRKIKGQLPMIDKNLKPNYDTDKFQQWQINKKNIEKNNFNRHTKPLPPLLVNDKVMVYDFRKNIWEAGKIVDIDKNRPRTYIVKIYKYNKNYIRNRIFLKKCHATEMHTNLFHTLLDSYIPDTDNSQEHDHPKKEKKTPVQNSNEKENSENNFCRRSDRPRKRPQKFADYIT